MRQRLRLVDGVRPVLAAPRAGGCLVEGVQAWRPPRQHAAPLGSAERADAAPLGRARHLGDDLRSSTQLSAL